MDGCPITCPCRRAGEGAFLLAGCIFAAVWSQVFLGEDFGTLVAAFLLPPHALALALAVWAVAASAGLFLLVIGIRALLREGDGGAALPPLAAIAASAFAMSSGWYLPPGWGALWSLGSEGFYLALIAGGSVNLCGAIAAQVWAAGYVAAGRPYPTPRSSAVDPDQWREIIERQARTIDSLTVDCRDLETVLRDPAVKKSVLKVLHPDAHPDASDRERRALTERFQKAAAVFDRLGAAR